MLGLALVMTVLIIVVWRKNRVAGIALMIVSVIVGIVALALWSLMQNISVGIDQNSITIQNPIATGDLSNGELNGILPLVISNPTPYGFLTIDSVSAVITDPDGNVLATISAPANINIPRNGSVSIPLAFTAQVETALVSAITQFFSAKSETAIITGRAYFLGGIAWYTFSSSVKLKI